MNAIAEKIQRNTLRNPTEATIACQLYASGEAVCSSNGVMRNFSKRGFYIEADRQFNPGTVLLVRVTGYPLVAPSATDGEWPRSICLAEVRWRQAIAYDGDAQFGMGLRYLDQLS